MPRLFRMAVLALAIPAAARAQAVDSATVAGLLATPEAKLPFDPRGRMRELPNGLRYYIRANARPAGRVEMRLVVNVGSVLEDDDQRGLAHVVEHMTFNGTRHFAKQQIVDFIERAGMKFGADLNAGTSFDETIYQLQLPTDSAGFVGRALDWFADIAGGGVTLDSAELARERPVIVEEWRLGRGAEERIQEQQFPALFRGSRYLDRVPIGTKESLDGFTAEAVRRFYSEWYRPDLMAVVVVGDIDPDSVEAMITARFGSIPPATNARPRDPGTVPGHPETLVAVAGDTEAQATTVGVIWKQPVAPRTTVRDYRREVTAALFLAMLNDRYQEIIRKPSAPFVNAGASQGRLVRALEVFSLSAIVEDGGIQRGLDALVTEAERARRFGFTEPELERAKADVQRSMDIQLTERDKTESAVYTARYADHFLTGEQVMGIELRAPLVRALMREVSVDDVNAIARQWIADHDRVILASAPLHQGKTLPADSALLAIVAAPRAALEPYTEKADGGAIVPDPPAPGRIVSERRIDKLDATEWTLSNGVRVIVKHTDFKDDEVLVSGASVGGASGLTPREYYSARLAPLMLERMGAGNLDADAIQKKLAGKRAAVSADIGDRDESISGQTSPGDIELFFEMMWARAMTPRLDSAAFLAFRQQYAELVRDRGNSPVAAYIDTISETMSRSHPLARPVSDSIVRTLDMNIAGDVFRDRFSDFSDFTFVIVGAVTPESVRPFVERWIGALPGGGRVDSARDPGIRPPEGHINKVIRKGSEPKAQTTIILTGEIPWTRESTIGAAAITEILSMRLRDTLREDLGGTYNVGVSVNVDRWPAGRFTTSIAFGAAPERIDSLANVALEVMRGFAQNGPKYDEIQKIREGMRRQHEVAIRENEFWVNLLQAGALWGDDPVEIYTSFDKRVEGVNPESLKALARIVLAETNSARFTLLPEKNGRVP